MRTRKSNAGFSLLELLVVVTIIGVLAGAAVLSMGVLGSDREIEREASRLRSLLDLLREEAVMQSRDYGVSFSENAYRFYVYDYQQLKWVPPSGDDLLTEHELREPLEVELRIEDRDVVLEVFEDTGEDDEDEPEPEIMVLASGEMTPFEAAFYRDLTGGRYVLTGEIDGTMEIEQHGFEP